MPVTSVRTPPLGHLEGLQAGSQVLPGTEAALAGQPDPAA